MDADDRQRIDGNNVTTNAGSESSPIIRGRGHALPGRGAPRTPYTGSTRVYSRFKSPLQAPSTSSCPKEIKPSIQQEIEELRKKEAELDREIIQLECHGVEIQELEQHIDYLHEYNDVKDIGQTLLGKLATIRGVTTRDLYAQFGLELDD
ncbi:hypothetical protein GJAV_G00040990 [Gymnothorax javanicus]|nr:hypothetical protein GJAV_G00040990 [Gymnothorax javanicus]